MKIKIKKLHKDAVIPKYAKPGDAGMDLTAVSFEYDVDLGQVVYGTGLALEIPGGHVGLIFPRSSIYKTNMSLTNSVGVIDSGYRGEIMLRFKWDALTSLYKVGDRIGQIMIIPYPRIEFEEVEQLEDSERGEHGFGSTGG